ncbi:hypothetical protein PR048_027598 [Dryococelus australis]|uniref:Uncharacterized protein n=1 Tax=Dryococelus australis TaxID=614101 RepID=A0ABQ9GGY2_9NEOP|nr:hypothetical protein PR048_027598 [Dryococelus australis]
MERVSATVFHKVLLQSRSWPGSMLEGVIRLAVQLRPDRFITVCMCGLPACFHTGTAPECKGGRNGSSPISGIVRYDSHLRKSGVTRPEIASDADFRCSQMNETGARVCLVETVNSGLDQTGGIPAEGRGWGGGGDGVELKLATTSTAADQRHARACIASSVFTRSSRLSREFANRGLVTRDSILVVLSTLSSDGVTPGRSPPTTAIWVRCPAGPLLDFRMWGSRWTMPPVGGPSRGTATSPALAFQRRSILGSNFMSRHRGTGRNEWQGGKGSRQGPDKHIQGRKEEGEAQEERKLRPLHLKSLAYCNKRSMITSCGVADSFRFTLIGREDLGVLRATQISSLHRQLRDRNKPCETSAARRALVKHAVSKVTKVVIKCAPVTYELFSIFLPHATKRPAQTSVNSELPPPHFEVRRVALPAVLSWKGIQDGVSEDTGAETEEEAGSREVTGESCLSASTTDEEWLHTTGHFRKRGINCREARSYLLAVSCRRLLCVVEERSSASVITTRQPGGAYFDAQWESANSGKMGIIDSQRFHIILSQTGDKPYSHLVGLIPLKKGAGITAVARLSRDLTEIETHINTPKERKKSQNEQQSKPTEKHRALEIYVRIATEPYVALSRTFDTFPHRSETLASVVRLKCTVPRTRILAPTDCPDQCWSCLVAHYADSYHGIGNLPHRNEWAGETEDPPENPLTNGIVRHDSHMRESGGPARG